MTVKQSAWPLEIFQRSAYLNLLRNAKIKRSTQYEEIMLVFFPWFCLQLVSVTHNGSAFVSALRLFRDLPSQVRISSMMEIPQHLSGHTVQQSGWQAQYALAISMLALSYRVLVLPVNGNVFGGDCSHSLPRDLGRIPCSSLNLLLPFIKVMMFAFSNH